MPDGVNARLLTNRGAMHKRKPEQLFLEPATKLGVPQHAKAEEEEEGDEAAEEDDE